MKNYNDKKICFILCTNNDLFLRECLLYLSLLEVPAGYETEVLTISDAKSMTFGYNEGMNASDAKYKVYLHQDTFIINKHFIADLLRVFASDEKIGLVGMIGAERLSKDGVMWHEQRCGDFYRLDELIEQGVNDIEKLETGIREVEVVDGLLMATQYDVKWREDILKEWDFYDVSQCLEFRRAGLKVVVPAQNPSWVIHKCGAPSFWKYEQNRQVLLKEYPEIQKRDKRLHILFVPSEKIIITGLAVGLTIAGHNVRIWNRRTPIGDDNANVVEALEEFLEESHCELVVTYDFCIPVAIACHNRKTKYLAWVYDSPQFELYRKEVQFETNHIMVFDKIQYQRMKAYSIPHLYYGPLATDIEVFGAVSLSDEDERKYAAEVSFVGRLYNSMRFDELFGPEDAALQQEVDHIFASCFCRWDDNTTIYEHASDELVRFILEKEPVFDWDKYHLQEKFYVESFKLTRKLNELERCAVLNRVGQKHKVVLYTDDEKLENLHNVEVRPPINYMKEMPKVFYFSKINLNITSRSIESGIPQRIFDIMAVGGFVLTNYQPELEEYFEIGKDLEIFHNLQELEEKVDFYLSHEENRVRIAVNGYRKVRKMYSYTVKAAEMVDKVMAQGDTI